MMSNIANIFTFFSSGKLSEVKEKIKIQMKEEIFSYDSGYILGTNLDEICKYLVSKYSLGYPRILSDQIYVDEPSDVKIDMSSRYSPFYGRPVEPEYVRGTQWTVHIPMEGDLKLLRLQAQAFTTNPPRGAIQSGEVLLSIELTPSEQSEQNISQIIKRQIDDFERHVKFTENDARQFNESLEGITRSVLEAKKRKALMDREALEKIPYKIRKRNDTQIPFVVPSIRKKIQLSQPSADSKPQGADSFFELSVYENILETLANMTQVMELSPSAFETMNEESLRWHFLVSLNGIYEGEATGETFNYEGKTDIIVKREGKNIFIAECKFWNGEEEFKKAIDQLLGYSSWRDTKIAILLFNRRKDFSEVVRKMKETVEGHPNFIRHVDYKNETGYRCLLRHKDDEDRELMFTVLAFNVPSKKT